jgi:hypothetical protein
MRKENLGHESQAATAENEIWQKTKPGRVLRAAARDRTPGPNRIGPSKEVQRADEESKREAASALSLCGHESRTRQRNKRKIRSSEERAAHKAETDEERSWRGDPYPKSKDREHCGGNPPPQPKLTEKMNKPAKTSAGIESFGGH